MTKMRHGEDGKVAAVSRKTTTTQLVIEAERGEYGRRVRKQKTSKTGSSKGNLGGYKQPASTLLTHPRPLTASACTFGSRFNSGS